MSTPARLDAAAIQALVTEVVRRITAGHAPVMPPAQGTAGSGVAPAFGSSMPTIPERVVTVACIDRLPEGIRQVAAVPTAVITPSAADRARDRGIAIVRSSQPVADVPTQPFLVAQAACRGDAAARAAALARAIPGGRHLPASELTDVLAALAGHAARDVARGILLTGKPAVAVVLANRSASLRAVTARDAPALASAAAEAAANLLVVDPATFPAGALERLCVAFYRAPTAALPLELAAAPPGCGCTTHPH